MHVAATTAIRFSKGKFIIFWFESESIPNQIYISIDSVEEYDPQKDEWRLVAPMNVKRSRVALCANMGKLWAIGGYDGESNLSTVCIPISWTSKGIAPKILKPII